MSPGFATTRAHRGRQQSRLEGRAEWPRWMRSRGDGYPGPNLHAHKPRDRHEW